MDFRSVFASGFFLAALAGCAVAAATWEKTDPTQWTSEDVYQILNNSPWAKSTTVTIADITRRQGGNGGGGWDEGMPGGMGRMGGGGMGRVGMPGGGMGRGRGYPSGESMTATVLWQSALPVRLAQEKTDGKTPDASGLTPLNQYVIAVIGLPKSGLGSSSTPPSDDDLDDARLADHLKVITVLSYDHQRLSPSKVELNQGRDGRAIFHFDKSEPITAKDKDVEFRITGDRLDLRKKFVLKDMQYDGKLQL